MMIKWLPCLLAIVWLMSSAAFAKDSQSVFERISDTRTIRCAYTIRPPMMVKDVNTKALSGVGFDLMEEIGKRLHLKIDWAEEVGYATIIESIKTSRVDMGCGIYFSNSARAPNIGFTKPIYYEMLHVYKRKDDPRTVASFSDLNDPQYTFSSIDGGTPIVLQKRMFPKSKQKTLPELSDQSEVFEDLVTKKADFVIHSDMTVMGFEKARPGLVEKLINKPIAYYPVVMFLPVEDVHLKSMLDTVLTEIEYDGTLEEILNRHGIAKMVKRNPLPQDF